MKKIEKLKSKLDDDIQRNVDDIARIARDELSHVAREYLHNVIDPKGSKPARIPTLLGGDPGLTSVIKMKAEGKFAVGTGGWGYVTIADPTQGGFCKDRAMGTHTTSLFSGDIFYNQSTTGGVEDILLNSPFTTADKLQYRPVGVAIYVTPVSSALNMDGSIYLLEPSWHEGLNTQTFDSLASWKRTRRLRGVQTGSLKDKIVLNVHPQAVQTVPNEQQINPFAFQYFDVNSNYSNNWGTGCVVFASGSPGVEYSYEIYITYEYRGKGAQASKVGLSDSRGMDLVLNTFRTKQLSGYVGRPHHVEHSYYAQLAHSARKAVESGSRMVKRSIRFIEDNPSLVNAAKALAGF